MPETRVYDGKEAPPPPEPPPKPWYQKPLGIIILSVIAGVVGAAILMLLDWM